ncbi:hypothetical protein [Paraburkholderia sediminicola]|uniref:hypothetical protein n=1 Tax=Paraburkholderia sediminicola TaxID=458836 RepID=UPI0038B93AC4
MRIVRRRGAELVSGDVLRTWFGNQTILEMRPYTGPFEFICSIARFPAAEMSIVRDSLYDVMLPG